MEFPACTSPLQHKVSFFSQEANNYGEAHMQRKLQSHLTNALRGVRKPTGGLGEAWEGKSVCPQGHDI
jgi:hypothetical protein